MGMSAGSSGGIKNEINVTPLVDVVLVLLIIFMVVTPMLQRGKDVHLPKATTTDEEHKDADPIILSITTDKRIFVEKDAYDDVNLARKLKDSLDASPGRKILLKGDETLTFGDVRAVMKVARTAGAKGISLGVEELKK
jgi:biopolymer transport protein TolR